MIKAMALILWWLPVAMELLNRSLPTTDRAILIVGGCVMWGMGEIVELLKKVSDRGTK